jgi:hypothetical protein
MTDAAGKGSVAPDRIQPLQRTGYWLKEVCWGESHLQLTRPMVRRRSVHLFVPNQSGGDRALNAARDGKLGIVVGKYDGKAQRVCRGNSVSEASMDKQ